MSSPAHRARWPFLALGGSAALVLGVTLLLRPDSRSAWEQASLTRGLPEERDPLQLTAWGEAFQELLHQADGLGPRPAQPERLQPWLTAQCQVNQRLQALQRQRRRPMEGARAMGRPEACEELLQRGLAVPMPGDRPGAESGAAMAPGPLAPGVGDPWGGSP